MATVLHPGRLSPTRQVPAEITRPEYVGRKRPKTGEPDVKTPEIIERMRVAGKLAAQALAEVGAHVAPGVTTDYLDQVGHDFLVSHGAYPSTLGYRGYPKSLCTSLNEVICHGIPMTRWSRTATSLTSTSRPSSAACTGTPTRRSAPGTWTRNRGCWWSAPTRR